MFLFVFNLQISYFLISTFFIEIRLQSNHLYKYNCCECSCHVVYCITVCDKELKPKPKLSDIS